MKRDISKGSSYDSKPGLPEGWKDWALSVMHKHCVVIDQQLGTMTEIRKHTAVLRRNIKALRAIRSAFRSLELVPPTHLSKSYIEDVCRVIEREVADKCTILEFGIPFDIRGLPEHGKPGRPRTPVGVAVMLLCVLDLALNNENALRQAYDFLAKDGELDEWRNYFNKRIGTRGVRRVPYPEHPKDWAPRYRITLQRIVVSVGRKVVIKRPLMKQDRKYIVNLKQQGMRDLGQFLEEREERFERLRQKECPA